MRVVHAKPTATVALLGLFAAVPAADAQQPAAPSRSTYATGGFSLQVPSTWRRLPPEQVSAFKADFEGQTKEMYSYYIGANLPAAKVDMIALRSLAGSILAAVSAAFPPDLQLMASLKEQVGDKAALGMRKGLVSSWATRPVTKTGFDGFQVDFENTDGSATFVGELQPSASRTRVIQVQFTVTNAERAQGVRQGSAAVERLFDEILASVQFLGATDPVAPGPLGSRSSGFAWEDALAIGAYLLLAAVALRSSVIWIRGNRAGQNSARVADNPVTETAESLELEARYLGTVWLRRQLAPFAAGFGAIGLAALVFWLIQVTAVLL